MMLACACLIVCRSTTEVSSSGRGSFSRAYSVETTSGIWADKNTTDTENSSSGSGGGEQKGLEYERAGHGPSSARYTRAWGGEGGREALDAKKSVGLTWCPPPPPRLDLLIFWYFGGEERGGRKRMSYFLKQRVVPSAIHSVVPFPSMNGTALRWGKQRWPSRSIDNHTTSHPRAKQQPRRASDKVNPATKVSQASQKKQTSEGNRGKKTHKYMKAPG